MERIIRVRNFAVRLSGAFLKKVFITHSADCFHKFQERWQFYIKKEVKMKQFVCENILEFLLVASDCNLAVNKFLHLHCGRKKHTP